MEPLPAVGWLRRKQFGLTRHCSYLLVSALFWLAALAVHWLLILGKDFDHPHGYSNVAAGHLHHLGVGLLCGLMVD